MECPLLKRRRKMYGRVALGVGVVGLLYYRPPQDLAEVAIAGAGAYVGLMAVDHLASTYPNWSMPSLSAAGKTGCGCGGK